MSTSMLKRRSLQGPAPFTFNSPARSLNSVSSSTSAVSTPKLESEASSSFSVQVAVRIRPSKPGDERPPNGDHSSQPPYIAHYTSNVISLPSLNSTFQYKKLISPETCQADVYTGLVCPLIQKFKSGYNATILAYGQTSSGKTYTMGTGQIKNNESDGIIPRAIGDIFNLDELEGKSQISISYLEIYNDDPIDLLSNNPGSRADIQVFENSKGQITWTGVTLVPVKGLEDVLKLLDQGSLHRRTGHTAMNSNSSRSHAIFTVYLKRDYIGDNGMSNSIQSKFHFVDLAGSERLKRTGASGDRAKEGISINGGLLALGNVIAALGKANGRNAHIPYRDSKLTRLLQDSIGGNSHTLMIACISPAYSDLTETLTTLQYANRAQRIKSKVVKNLTQTDDVDSLKLRIKSLETELELMKQNLIAPAPTTPTSAADPHQSTYPKVIEFLLSRVDNLTHDLHNSRVQYHKMHKKYTHLIEKIKRNGNTETDLSMISFTFSTLSPTGMNFNSLDIYNPTSPTSLNPPQDNHINLSDTSSSTSRGVTPVDPRSLSPSPPMVRPKANTISVPRISLENNNDKATELERDRLKAENLELSRQIEQLTQKLSKMGSSSSVASPLLSSSDLTLATEADNDKHSKQTVITECLAQGIIIGTDTYNTLTVEEKLQLLEDKEKKVIMGVH